MPPQALVQPNLWILQGGGIHIRYSTAGPNFFYQDPMRTHDFTGQEVRVVQVPDLGTLVSVTIFLTVDSGSSTFTLLLPRVNLPSVPFSSVPVSTEGITTNHHFSLLPAFQHGQQDFYSVTALNGTAWHI
jgi:hypothetical protein